MVKLTIIFIYIFTVDKEKATHSVFLPGKFHVQRSLVGWATVPGVAELDTT